VTLAVEDQTASSVTLHADIRRPAPRGRTCLLIDEVGGGSAFFLVGFVSGDLPGIYRYTLYPGRPGRGPQTYYMVTRDKNHIPSAFTSHTTGAVLGSSSFDGKIVVSNKITLH
jgi:hypothetical protein